MIPSGWKDDGHTLTAPNGVKVMLGFRTFMLNYPGGWDPADWPLAEELHADPLEYSNPGLGEGQKLCCIKTTLEYTESRGVFQAWQGQEIYALLQILKKQPAPAVDLADLIALLKTISLASSEALAELGVAG